MLLWGLLSIIAFFMIVRIIKIFVFKNESETGQATVSAAMQNEITEALREKYAAIDLVAKDSEIPDSSGKKERAITFEINHLDDIENATDAVLRDLLRWFNLLGLDCSGVVVSAVVPSAFADHVTTSFNTKIRAHKRVQEMERMGCSVNLETIDPKLAGDSNSE